MSSFNNRNMGLGTVLFGVILLVVLALPGIGAVGQYGTYVMILMMIYAIASTGLTLFMGYTGQLSIGHAAFYGIGAYTAANLTKLGVPFLPAMLLGGLLSCVAGYVLGYISLRLRGFYLAATTLAFGLIAFHVFKNFDMFTGGVSGLGRIPPPSIGPLDLSKPVPYFYFCTIVLFVVVVISAAIVRSPTGRAMRAISSSELAAQSTGINTYWIKIHVFALSAAYAGIAGAIYAHLLRYISPDDFSFIYSIMFLSMAIVGGLGHVFGGAIGAIVVTFAAEELRSFPQLQPILYGGVLMLLVMYMPTGLAGLAALVKRYMDTLFKRLGSRADKAREGY